MADSNTSNKLDRTGIGGRPTKLTPEVLKKLEEAFAIGASDKEACFYADISHQTLYNYQEKHPEFVERKNALKERPVLMARQTILNNMNNPDIAKWYLERKLKKEFSARSEVTGADGKDLPMPIVAFDTRKINKDAPIEAELVNTETSENAPNPALLPHATPIEPIKSGNIMDDITNV